MPLGYITHVPSGPTSYWGTANQSLWVDEIYPYIKNYQVFKCPSDASSSKIGYGWGAYRGYFNGISYSPPRYGEIYEGVPIGSSDIRDVAVTPIICDHDNPSVNSTYYFSWYISGRYNRVDGVVSTVHSDGQNICFMDGHVKWYRPSAAMDHSYDNGPLQWVATW